MNTRGRRLSVPAFGAVIAMLAIAAPAPHAGAAPASACTATSGVTVIVDLTHFHLAIERGCAPGNPGSALAALRSAGFDTAGTAQYGDAFLCRINGRPSSTKESCARTPPTNSSWSFYWARPTDAAWTYSSSGVTSFDPAAGSLIGFAFGNYAKPGVRPPGVIRAPAPTTTITTALTVAPTVAPARAPESTPPPPTTTPIGAPVATAPPPTTTATATPSSIRPPASTRAASSTTTTPPVVEQTAAGGTHGSSGSPLPAVLALVLIVILGIAGGLTIRAGRRRPA